LRRRTFQHVFGAIGAGAAFGPSKVCWPALARSSWLRPRVSGLALAVLALALGGCSVEGKVEVRAAAGPAAARVGTGPVGRAATTAAVTAPTASTKVPPTSPETALPFDPYAPEPPASEYTWLLRPGPALPKDAGLDRPLFLDARSWCGATHQKVRLRCLDPATGAVKFTFERPTTVADAPQLQFLENTSAGFLLGYQVAKNFVFYELDASGAERRTYSFPVVEGEPARVQRAERQGKRLVFSYARRHGKSWATFVRSLDAATGRLEREIAFDVNVSAWGVAGDVLYAGSDHDKVAVSAFDLTSGKKLMSRSLGREFMHGITAGPDGVYVQLDQEVVLVDARGNVKGRARIERRGNPPPRLAGERVLVCEGGVRIFDRNLKPLGRVEHPRWVLDCTVDGHFVIVHARQDVYVVDLDRPAIEASFTLPENHWVQDSGRFDGARLPLIDAVMSSDPGSRRLSWLVRTGARQLAVRGLPEGARLLEDGEPAPTLVPRGQHAFDVYRPDSWPVRVELDVRVDRPAELDLGNVKLTAAPVRAAVRPDHLPAGLEITDLKRFGGRSEQRIGYGSHGSFADGGRRIALDGREGLFAHPFRRETNDWVVSAAALEADAPPTDPKTPFTSAQLFAVLPEARLALLATRGHAPGALIAYDLDDGSKRWKVSTPLLREPGSGEYYVPHALSAGGLVWYQTDEWLYGHDERDGHLVYRQRLSDQEGLWGLPVVARGRVFAIHKQELLGVDLATRQVVWKTPLSGRGFLTLGPNDAYLLFVDDKQARAISFEGRSLASSPSLGGGLDDNPVLAEPDGVYLCGQYQKTTHRLDPVTLRPRWTFTNSGGEAPCPSLFSATQVATLDSKLLGPYSRAPRTLVLDRATGKVLLDELNFLPLTRHAAADGASVCVLERKGSVCFER
jgi:outer membrane protein assembly factor BamB